MKELVNFEKLDPPKPHGYGEKKMICCDQCKRQIKRYLGSMFEEGDKDNWIHIYEDLQTFGHRYECKGGLDSTYISRQKLSKYLQENGWEGINTKSAERKLESFPKNYFPIGSK